MRVLTSVGPAVGLAVGLMVGPGVGAAVGWGVGPEVGAGVGRTVGECVGPGVGEELGSSCGGGGRASGSCLGKSELGAGGRTTYTAPASGSHALRLTVWPLTAAILPRMYRMTNSHALYDTLSATPLPLILRRDRRLRSASREAAHMLRSEAKGPLPSTATT